jgi:quinolinate synthase
LTEQGRIDQGIQDKIAALKRQRHAVILAHNYQRAEVQDIADFVGDSFELSQNAAGSQAKVIVFCGVHFMAETASILCPDKQVLLPDINAGCNMADMITAEQLRQKKREYPGACVVCYINTSAEVKAMPAAPRPMRSGSLRICRGMRLSLCPTSTWGILSRQR